MQTLVGRAVPSPERVEAVPGKMTVIDRARLRTAFDPCKNLRKVFGASSLDGASVKLAEHAAPKPAFNFVSNVLSIGIISECRINRSKRDKLSAVWQVA